MVLLASLIAALLVEAATWPASIALAAESASPEHAEAPPEAKARPALWTLRDEDTVVILFGHASALPEGTVWRSPDFDRWLAEADVVVLESISTGPAAVGQVQSAIRTLGFNEQGTMLTGTMDDIQVEALAGISNELGFPMETLERLRPWLASIQIGVLAAQRQGLDLANTPATVIATEAADNGAEIIALEGPADLIHLMAGLQDDEQVGLLMHSVIQLREDPDQIAQANSTWLAGDIDALAEIHHGRKGAWSSDKVYDLMLVDRNSKWREKIESLLESKTGVILVAVGAGHLAGPDSLVTMLSDAGWEVQRQ